MFRRTVLLSGILLSGSALAAVYKDAAPPGQFFIGLSPGVTWVSGNQTQTINLESDVQKTYTANNNSNSIPTVELFMGWQTPFTIDRIKQSLTGQVGLSVGTTGNAQLSGNIWEDANPNFNNFIYNYNVRHTSIAIKGRLVDNTDWIDPYLSCTLGVGFNRASHFTSTPIVSGEVPAPPFGSNTTATFTYAVGVGLQKSITPHLQIAVGYEFADWGKTQLAAAAGQTQNQGPTLNHLYSNQALLSLFYVA